ncbi:MAG: 5-methylcytosine-specific restriction enzyme subunit McrC, partial [Psychromonas sp.]|uniref:5-methylcytosine restriction system specificity protein McrC n=1 Tax=Psychromonas sp. TaxID=1884585 RepID=UPI0039E569DA
PKVYQNTSEHSHKVRGKIDLNAYLRKSIPFSGKLTSTLREQAYVQEIVDVLFLACTILERNFGKEVHRKVLGTLQLLKQHYSGNYPSHKVIEETKSHVSLQNPVFSGFKRVIEYAQIIIKDRDLLSSNINKSLKTQGYLFDISQLFEVYLQKMLSRYFVDWYVTGQEELTVYSNQFYRRKMFPDLVLKHKETGKVIVFDAKFKTMNFTKKDLDREDFYQIHSYIQYYSPNLIFGGLIYPLSKEHDGNLSYAKSLFENEANDAGFIVDGIYVNENMPEQKIIGSEQRFLARLEQFIINCG